MNYHTSFCLTVAFCLAAPTMAWAVITSDTPGSHVVTPGEPMYGVNLDGVVLLGFPTPVYTSVSDLIPFCSGALISDWHLLTAGHCLDSDYDGLVDSDFTAFPFADNPIVAGFELSDGSVFRDVVIESIVFPPQWPETDVDIAVMTLTEPAPADVPRYPIYALSDEVGKQIVIAGYGNAGHGSTGSVESMGVKRAGLNRYDTAHDLLFLAYDFDSGLPENDSLGLSGFESDLGFGVDEVMGANGDSGGPSFIGGVIAGVYSGTARHDTADVNDTLDHSWGEAGFDARVSLYQDFLAGATAGQVVFVPEPSTWGLLTLGSLFMGLFRKING